MKRILLLILTIILFILLIISKDINILLALFLLFIPLIISLYYLNKEGTEIIKYNKITILFYLVISITYYLITNSFLSSIILLLQMLLYYFYNPKLIIDKEYIYSDTIILKKKINIHPHIIDKYNKAGLNIINKSVNTNKLVANSNTDLIRIYHEIELNRSKYENLVRGEKLHLISSFIIPLIVVFIFIFKLPNPLNIPNIIIINFLFALSNIYLSIYLPSENDIMLRNPRKKNENLFSKEEKLFIVVNIFCFLAAITIPYMLVLYKSTDSLVANYIFILSLIITNIINIAYNLNDSITLLNIIRFIFNKAYFFILGISTIIIILFRYFYNRYYYFGLANTIRLIIIIIIIICWEDIIKLARFLKSRKKVKNVRNN